MTDNAEDPRITRARLSGPQHVTKDATVAEIAADGTVTVLVNGTNEWVCTPGNENKIGDPPMCMNPMGMRWMMDAQQGKPKPTNTAPGMIYMLCGATQRSNTNPSDKNQSRYSNRTALDDHMAFRCFGKWTSDHGSRQRRLGDVCGNPLRVFARLRHAVGRQ
jgi:hypothetical protein